MYYLYDANKNVIIASEVTLMNKLEFHKLPEKGSITFTLRLPKDLNERIEGIVKETGISKNAVINKMIRFSLENAKIIEE
jgi:predicted HicB family RNase H-like nuclease